MPKNFKYFVHGYPAVPTEPIYALYQPVLDCFVLLVPSKDLACKVKYILSSKYSTYVVRLDTAENFEQNLIDNEICEQWTLSNKNDIAIDIPFENAFTSAKKLCKTNHLIKWDRNKEKQRALICLFWVNMIEKTKQSQPYTDVDLYLKDVVQENLDYTTQSFYDQILKILYLTDDAEQADQQLTELMNSTSLHQQWFNWIQNGYQ